MSGVNYELFKRICSLSKMNVGSEEVFNLFRTSCNLFFEPVPEYQDSGLLFNYKASFPDNDTALSASVDGKVIPNQDSSGFVKVPKAI